MKHIGKYIDGEVWKDSPIYGEAYEISNMGRVRNKTTGHILKPQEDNKGYLRIRLSLHDKKATGKIHRMVAIAFLDNPEGKPQVNHIDTDKHNNFVGNLEWATNGENQIHAYQTGLNYVTGRAGRKKIAVLMMNDLGVVSRFDSIGDAARSTGIQRQNIEKVIKGERPRAGGYRWMRESEVMPYDETQ